MKTVREHRNIAGGPLFLLVLFLIVSSLRAGAYDYGWYKNCRVDCILISISEQRLDVFGDHQLIGWSTISSGREGYPTPTGQFEVTEKDLNHHSNLYHNAPMPYFLRLTDGGVGMHAGDLPGYPASHGCIRLPYEMARHLYQCCDSGTFVQILRGPIDSVFDPTPAHKTVSGTVANN
jgi:hypothetical protein